MIPANIDQIALLADLNRLGWKDYMLTEALGFSEGYISQLKCGNVAQMSYQKAARLYNFWCEEMNASMQNLPKDRQ